MSSGGKTISKVLGTTAVLTVASAGGIVGYSAVDPDFRKILEENIPGSQDLLELVIGKAEIPPPPKPVPSKLKLSSPVMVTVPKKEEKPSPAVEETPKILPSSGDQSSEENKVQVIEPEAVVEVEPSAKAELATVVVKEEDTPSPQASTTKEEPVIQLDLPKIEEPIKEVIIEKSVETASSESTKIEEPIKEVVIEKSVETAASVIVEKETESKILSDETPLLSEPVQQQIESVKEEIVKTSPSESSVKEEVPVSEIISDETPILSEPVQQQIESVVVETSPPESLAKEELPVTVITEKESEIDVENTSLELSLKELCAEMKDKVTDAVSGYEVSSEAEMIHIDIMRKVLESNLSTEESAWNDMFVAAKEKSEKTRNAENKEKEAVQSITNVLDSIEAGRKNKLTATNANLLLAEEAANHAIYILDQAKVKKADIQSEASVMETYKNLVEAGREQFHKEMSSIMPDVKLGEKSGKLTEEELNMFITHAYKKVLFLQQELAKQQTLEQERFKKALEKQRIETEASAARHMEGELEKQAREIHTDHERKMVALKEESESDLRAQLKRQAAAHTDHLTDVLAVQEAELRRHHEHELGDKIESLNAMHQSALSSLGGAVSGLSSALQERASSDAAALASQSLWLASNSLNSAILLGVDNATSWDGKLKPLKGEVEMVKSAAGNNDEFVKTVLGSLSPIALERGVYTEDSLIERFGNVETVAKRVAGIGEQGGSLLAFGLSYLQSILMVNTAKRNVSESEELINLSEASPSDIVNLAKFNLERGNLARAVQLMTLLKGEAGRVASDWVSEARLTLETRQAIQAVMAHSLANCSNSLPGM